MMSSSSPSSKYYKDGNGIRPRWRLFFRSPLWYLWLVAPRWFVLWRCRRNVQKDTDEGQP